MSLKLGEVLKRAGVIDEYQLATALAEKDRWGHRLGVTLIKLGYVEEDELVRALAHQMRLPMARLEGRQVEWNALRLIPGDVAEQTMTLPLHVETEHGKDVLYLGMEDPTNFAVLDDLRFRAGTEIRPVLVAPSELAEGIDRFYRTGGYIGSESALPMSSGIIAHKDIPIADLSLPDPPAREPERAAPARDETKVIEPMRVSSVFGDEVLEFDVDHPLTAEEPAKPAASAVASDADSTRRILQAVAQLLVERGVLDRDELRERVRALEKRSAPRDGTP